MTTLIRPATIADLEKLAALEAACFNEPWTLHALTEALLDEKYVVLVAHDDDSINGYVIGWSVGEEAELARVGVATRSRDCGFGEHLVRALQAEFAVRGVQRIFLEVRVSNLVAKRLYARCGFVSVGCRRRYYTDGEDADVMSFGLTTTQLPYQPQ